MTHEMMTARTPAEVLRLVRIVECLAQIHEVEVDALVFDAEEYTRLAHLGRRFLQPGGYVIDDKSDLDFFDAFLGQRSAIVRHSGSSMGSSNGMPHNIQSHMLSSVSIPLEGYTIKCK